ncbi:hypothetical protein WJM93_14285 [Lactiplantibacillus plantarum]|uniref:hypothetical protein n=1 Tax=Lactiplantibacillus plantarum TaxID=1590 RepID=UPI000CD349EF|nr:hypothetical protein [Lactiplantibacillus plantarum]AUV74225.1 hypothetical protein C1940_17385 [Lactiplantibacillus plantarum subsp. plantarum]
MKSKLMILGVAAGFLFLLSGCSYEQSDTTMANTTTAQIGNQTNVSINSKSQQENYKSLNATHTMMVDGQTLKFKTNYGIEKRLTNNWYFTVPSTIELGINPLTNIKGLSYQVNALYADVSILSKYTKYNGVRQDSFSTNYGQLKNGGIDVDNNHGYNMPFQVEGINENETSVTVINGYGSSDTERITEKDLRENAYGGRLRVVWTLLVTDQNSGKQYSQTIQDSIGLPYKHSTED